MNNDKDKYDELISRIKSMQPQIPDSQKLIFKTMDSIERLPKRRNYNKMLTFVSLSSSVAALFLMGIFIFEMHSPPKNEAFASSKIAPVIEKNRRMENPTTLSEFSKILSIKTARRQEQRAFYSSLVNKYKNI